MRQRPPIQIKSLLSYTTVLPLHLLEDLKCNQQSVCIYLRAKGYLLKIFLQCNLFGVRTDEVNFRLANLKKQTNRKKKMWFSRKLIHYTCHNLCGQRGSGLSGSLLKLYHCKSLKVTAYAMDFK